jgi:hypothetical protein
MRDKTGTLINSCYIFYSNHVWNEAIKRWWLLLETLLSTFSFMKKKLNEKISLKVVILTIFWLETSIIWTHCCNFKCHLYQNVSARRWYSDLKMINGPVICLNLFEHFPLCLSFDLNLSLQTTESKPISHKSCADLSNFPITFHFYYGFKKLISKNFNSFRN